MIDFSLFRASTGEFLSTGIVRVVEELPLVNSGTLIILQKASYDSYLLNNTVYEYTEDQKLKKIAKPGFFYTWSNQSMEWIDNRPLEFVVDEKWSNLKMQRDEKLYEPLLTDYGVFDADARSQKNITDAIALMQTAEAQQPGQTIMFTLADNSVTTLTTQQMVNVGLALGQRTQQIYNTSRQLRAQLDAAQTVQEVEAITWPT